MIPFFSNLSLVFLASYAITISSFVGNMFLYSEIYLHVYTRKKYQRGNQHESAKKFKKGGNL